MTSTELYTNAANQARVAAEKACRSFQEDAE